MSLSFLQEAYRQKEITKSRSSRRRVVHGSKTWVAPEIHLDLLIEILTRLPAKSVMRFKCVSKTWSYLFSLKYFCNRFLMAPSRPEPRLYMSLVYKYSKSLLLSSAPATSTSSTSLVFDHDLTIEGMGGWYMRLVRGFICYTLQKKARIYNPTTRQLVILPCIESDIVAQEPRYSILYFLGHDPVKDQYKILCTITVLVSEESGEIKSSERWVFVLEAGSSWKRVTKEFSPHLPVHLELIMNGVLYYSAWTNMHTCVLVSFDIMSEEFDMMQVPGNVISMLERRVTQIDYGGKVAVFDTTYLKETGTVDLWVVEDWKKKEWSRKSLVLKPSQVHLVIDNRLIPKNQTLKGKVIFESQDSPFYLLCFDLQTNDLKRVEIQGVHHYLFSIPETPIYFDLGFMVPSESIMYLET